MRTRIFALAVLATSGAGCGNELTQPSERTYVQVDYMGRAAIATVFLPTGQKDAYNQSVPTDQRSDYGASVIGFLTGVAGYTDADANGLADVLLPDILTIDLTAPSGYLNGRNPSDDVTTASLRLVFGPGTPLSDDNVDANDVPYPNTFPYLAQAHR